MNIVIVKQGSGRYLFSVPSNVSLKAGDTVKCDTRRGITDGVCWCDSLDVSEEAAKLIGNLTGATFPLKSVVGKTVTSVEMFDNPQQLPKLYCVSDDYYCLTHGKIYEFDADGHFECDCFKTTKSYTNLEDLFKDYISWKNCLFPLVSRPAKAGELVLLLSDDCCKHNQKGSIAKMVKEDFIEDPIGEYPFGIAVSQSQYLVLEGYNPSQYYNGKVVCVDYLENLDSFVVGKVYEFKDGIVIDEFGKKYNFGCPVKTLEEFNTKSIVEFIEYKGEHK